MKPTIERPDPTKVQMTRIKDEKGHYLKSVRFGWETKFLPEIKKRINELNK